MRSLSLPILALALVQGGWSETADSSSIRPPPPFSLGSLMNSTSSISRTSSTTPSSYTSSKTSSSISSTSLSTVSLSTSNSSGNGTTAGPTPCTGCVLEAFRPTTLTFETEGVNISTLTSIVGTVITSIISYDDGETTITSTKYQTGPGVLNATARPTNVFTELTFTWQPDSEVTLTFTSGTTYVAYTRIYGGVERTATPTDNEPLPTISAPTAYPTCDSSAYRLHVWPPEDGNFDPFIQTLTGSSPPIPTDGPVSLPPALIRYLQGNPDLDLFSLSRHQLSTCTLNPKTGEEPFHSIAPTHTETEPPPLTIGSSKTGEVLTSTLLTTTFTESTVHVASPGACLRTPCQNPLKPTNVAPIQTDGPDIPQSKIQEVPGDKPTASENLPNTVPGDNTAPGETPTPPSIPEQIASIILGNPSKFIGGPTDAPGDKPIKSATFSDAVLPIAPLQPTGPGNPPNGPQNTQNVPNPQIPGVIIGDHTLTPGQAITINGVPVSVPANAGGSSVVIGGSTFAVGNPSAPTGAPVLTVGGNVVTANPSGQFVIGTQTLNPGGPAIVVSGTTLSLGPSGTIAVVNGATQTLGNDPFITGPPALTINGQTIPATVVGGTTEFVLGEGETLTPGGILVAEGSTFSLPAGGSGSTVVINGVTQTLSPAAGLPILTANGNNPITASVVGGTTQFVIGPGQTLTPGGSIVVSGTTFSMLATASGSVVVVNGVTSTLGHPGQITAAPALTIDGKTYSPTVKDGTTEYVLGPGTTIKPGEGVTISGTTYSLDKSGTALVVNGKTSTIPKTPASNTASTTGSSSSGSTDSSETSSGTSSTTSQRPPGNFIASGIGVTRKKGGATALRSGGLDKWVEGMVIGLAGWLVVLF